MSLPQAVEVEINLEVIPTAANRDANFLPRLKAVPQGNCDRQVEESY
jgi:hypothetical protein